MHWQLYLNFLAALFSIINPIGIVPMWSELTRDEPRKIRKRIAIYIGLTAVASLLIFLNVGVNLLDFFAIDLAVFQIAGGILLFITGMQMVNGKAVRLSSRDEDGPDLQIARKRFRKIITPMAIPRLSGPGSITTVVLYGSKAESAVDFGVMSLTVIFVIAILVGLFAFADRLEKKIDNVVMDVITRLFGVIIAAIAMQFIIEGLAREFPAWAK